MSIEIAWVFATWLAAALALSAAAGCSFGRLRDDLDVAERRALVVGTVEEMAGRAPALVAALREGADGAAEVVAFTVRHDGSAFRFLLEPGRYRIAAFEDRDRDTTYDPGEPVATPQGGAEVALEAGERLIGLRLRFDADRAAALVASIKPAPAVERRAKLHLKTGEAARLEDDRFSAANGALGYWQPLTFHDRLGAGIYALGPIDGRRLPVLLVHGAAGFPQQLGPIAAGLDAARCQAWVAHYPSGARLDVIADALVSALEVTCAPQGITRVAVVAHSMGGLVSRAVIQRLAAAGSAVHVETLVTVSTPWAGHEAAAIGVEHAPAVVPSWVDMAPRSPFIEETTGRPLPPWTRHHLLFGFRGGEAAFAGPGDGTVSLASMLDARVQDAAASVRGFDEDHVSILAGAPVAARVRALLGSEDGAAPRH